MESPSTPSNAVSSMNVTEAGTGVLADLHQKLLDVQAKELQMPPQAGKETAALVGLLNALKNFQMSIGRQQNAELR